MRIAITGASGFVGSALTGALHAASHDVVRLVRAAEPGHGAAKWTPATGEIDRAALGRVDAVVHLAGENIAGGRWTAARKRAIADSRIGPTAALCRTLLGLPHPPRTLVCASAIGIYGDRGDELLDEQSAPGTGFLADVAERWERATDVAAAGGIRVVNLRFGMVLDGSGGALPRIARPFRFGVGGRLGDGRQWMSWITRHDLVRALRFALEHDALRGPVLGVAPEPVTNREFTRALAHALHRPAMIPAPRFALRVVLGEMADMVLASQRCVPARLTAAGFGFEQPTLDVALPAVLNR